LLSFIMGLSIGVSTLMLSQAIWLNKRVKRWLFLGTCVENSGDDENEDDEEEDEEEDAFLGRYESFLSDNSAVPLDSAENFEKTSAEVFSKHSEHDLDLFSSNNAQETRLSKARRSIMEKMRQIKSVIHPSSSQPSYRICEFICLLTLLTAFTIGPNIVFVYIAIGDYPSNVKVITTVLVAIVKSTFTSLIIPPASDKIATCLFPHSTLGHRFRTAVNLGVFISALSFVLGPIAIVGITDTRCLKYIFHPQDKVTGYVNVEICAATGYHNQCLGWVWESLESSYTPQF
jgi:hypothetical protein